MRCEKNLKRQNSYYRVNRQALSMMIFKSALIPEWMGTWQARKKKAIPPNRKCDLLGETQWIGSKQLKRSRAERCYPQL
ncbi:hypothetical protein O9992_27710 [Vibrio lentus]|nr:hypothetical protein [Vibrio lentus]